jgi:hypothetical protein
MVIAHFTGYEENILLGYRPPKIKKPGLTAGLAIRDG